MMQRFLLAALFLFLSVTGGMQFYLNPVIQITYLLAGLIVIMVAFYFFARGDRPPLLPSAMIMIGALIISALANIDIYAVAIGRIIQAMIAAGALVVAYRLSGVKEALYLAGWVWPFLCIFTINSDNRNIATVWPMLFIIIGFTNLKWFYMLLNFAILLYLGSYGALIGLAIGIFVLIYPVIKPIFFFTFLPSMVVILSWLKPHSALIRFDFWKSALTAFINHPIFGLGPGGLAERYIINNLDSVRVRMINNDLLDARDLIYAGYIRYVHAHNAIITMLAENGLIGLIFVFFAWWILPKRLNFARWQWSILAALTAHSLVDEPLWWIGPLVAAALILGGKD